MSIDEITKKVDSLCILNESSNIIPSNLQTKDWRKNSSWYDNGKHNECEKYQRNLIEKITKNKCNKTNLRFNLLTYELLTLSNPMKNNNGFEFSEDFDGFIDFCDNKYYFNLKMVCDDGGAQTRTLREVYHFINSQLNNLIKYDVKDVYYVNILDGNTSHKNMSKFNYLLNKIEFIDIKKYIFIGDMFQFNNWWNSIYSNK